jgi:hypothetical protein
LAGILGEPHNEPEMQIFSIKIGLFEKIYVIRLFLAAVKRQHRQAI